MRTFEQELNVSTWTEILQGGAQVAFDAITVAHIYVYLDEVGDTDPTADTKGNLVRAYPPGWDFQYAGAKVGTQRVWVRGENSIRGVR